MSFKRSAHYSRVKRKKKENVVPSGEVWCAMPVIASGLGWSAWISEQVDQRKSNVDGVAIREKARSIYDHLAEKEPSGSSPAPGFIASHGWFHRFKQRLAAHNIARTAALPTSQDDHAVIRLTCAFLKRQTCQLPCCESAPIGNITRDHRAPQGGPRSLQTTPRRRRENLRHHDTACRLPRRRGLTTLVLGTHPLPVRQTLVCTPLPVDMVVLHPSLCETAGGSPTCETNWRAHPLPTRVCSTTCETLVPFPPTVRHWCAPPYRLEKLVCTPLTLRTMVCTPLPVRHGVHPPYCEGHWCCYPPTVRHWLVPPLPVRTLGVLPLL
ncbi:hypothetical protein GWK47_032429 [Chionoecetes opilio]|uniref:HTH CENPB-type domain-containing protein n=1 Tax=Chionoecetes opilio TaxID=41210 RepID=A0A8J5CQ16_CHIOP|nr:hypothetical protein GWK47_032429 [Chionoecetes opilio]